MKPSPDRSVVGWMRAHNPRDLYTSSVTLAEVHYGIERLDSGRRKTLFMSMAEEIFASFEEQILPFDRAAAIEYAAVVSARENGGLPIDGFDAQIAAICRANSASLATRNVKDFQGTGIDIVDPWQHGWHSSSLSLTV